MQLSIPVVALWALLLPTAASFDRSSRAIRIVRKLKSRASFLASVKRSSGRHLQITGSCGADVPCPDVQFCNYDNDSTGDCESCPKLSSNCPNDGLPSAGVDDCTSLCPVQNDEADDEDETPAVGILSDSYDEEFVVSTPASNYDDFFTGGHDDDSRNDDFGSGDDGFGDLLGLLLGALGFDEELMQCLTETNEIQCNSDTMWDVQEKQEDFLKNAMEAGTSIDIPQDLQDDMSEACMDAGGVLEKYSKFDCAMEDGAGNVSIKGMSMCTADSPSCKSQEASGGVFNALMEMETAISEAFGGMGEAMGDAFAMDDATGMGNAMDDAFAMDDATGMGMDDAMNDPNMGDDDNMGLDVSSCDIELEVLGSVTPSEDEPKPSTPPALAEPEPSTSTSPAIDSAGAVRPWALACLAGVAASAGILVGI